MLNPKKKLAKKEIKQDPLLSTYEKAEAYYYENKKYVSYGTTALVVIIIALVVFVNNRRGNNEKATIEVAKVFGIYDAGATDVQQYKAAINGQPERGVMGLKTIVDNYGGTESGELARFYLANAYYNLGQYDDALQQYDHFSGSTDLLKASAMAGMGGCYEGKHEYSKAGQYFEKASNTNFDPNTTPDYLSSAARCYGLAGEKEKAVALMKRVKKEFPTSTFARDADRYINQFST